MRVASRLAGLFHPLNAYSSIKILMRYYVIPEVVVKKHNVPFMLLVCVLAMPLRAAGPIAGTAEDITNRLQKAIDRASEQGNYSHVQILRAELADHYASNGVYALAARQY